MNHYRILEIHHKFVVQSVDIFYEEDGEECYTVEQVEDVKSFDTLEQAVQFKRLVCDY